MDTKRFNLKQNLICDEYNLDFELSQSENLKQFKKSIRGKYIFGKKNKLDKKKEEEGLGLKLFIRITFVLAIIKAIELLFNTEITIVAVGPIVVGIFIFLFVSDRLIPYLKLMKLGKKQIYEFYNTIEIKNDLEILAILSKIKKEENELIRIEKEINTSIRNLKSEIQLNEEEIQKITVAVKKGVSNKYQIKANKRIEDRNRDSQFIEDMISDFEHHLLKINTLINELGVDYTLFEGELGRKGRLRNVAEFNELLERIQLEKKSYQDSRKEKEISYKVLEKESEIDYGASKNFRDEVNKKNEALELDTIDTLKLCLTLRQDDNALPAVGHCVGASH